MTYPSQGGHPDRDPTWAAGHDHGSAYPAYPGSPSQSGEGADYATQAGFGSQPGYEAQPGYLAQSGYQPAGGYQPSAGAQWAAGARMTTPWPPSNVGWAIASIIFFWPLAFVAMTRALDVYPLWAAGRQSEAESASATAKNLGIISLVIAAVLLIGYFVFVFVIVGAVASTTSGYN